MPHFQDVINERRPHANIQSVAAKRRLTEIWRYLRKQEMRQYRQGATTKAVF